MHKILKKIKENKMVTLLSVLVIILLGAYAFSSLTGQGISYNEGLGQGDHVSRDSAEASGALIGDDSRFKIKSGSVNVKSDDGSEDANSLKEYVDSNNGEVESENIYETETSITHTVSFKIPLEHFDSALSWIEGNYDVKTANVNERTEDLGRIQNEINTILESIEIYDEMLEEARSRSPSSENTQLIFEITQKKLELSRQLSNYGYIIGETEERSQMPMITVSFNENKEIDYVPEDIGRNFKLNVKTAIDRIIGILSDLIPGIFVVLFETIKWIIYASVIALPLWLIYKWGKKRLK